jgi:hypothetical protein
MFEFDFKTFEGYPGFAGIYHRVNRRPSWVRKWTLIAAAVVFIVPLAVLALAAAIVGTVVFIVLGLVAQVVSIVRSAFGSFSGDGRRNVRVVNKD